MIEWGGWLGLFMNNDNTIGGGCQTLTLLVYNSNRDMYIHNVC
jgi:hypothetical protein